jgi:hypothetical protein
MPRIVVVIVLTAAAVDRQRAQPEDPRRDDQPAVRWPARARTCPPASRWRPSSNGCAPTGRAPSPTCCRHERHPGRRRRLGRPWPRSAARPRPGPRRRPVCPGVPAGC